MMRHRVEHTFSVREHSDVDEDLAKKLCDRRLARPRGSQKDAIQRKLYQGLLLKLPLIVVLDAIQECFYGFLDRLQPNQVF